MVLAFLVALLASILIALAAAWGTLALWYRAPGHRVARALCAALWAAFALACIGALWLGCALAAIAAFAAALGGLLLWWIRLRPSNQRAWADDVSQTVSGTIDGEKVTLHEVRDFIWRTEKDYTPRWVTRTYELTRLDSLDMIVSYWTGPLIAHMLISFGFDDGAHLVYSVEIRRQKTQTFSEIGGFFKEFELVIIAAEERDIVRLRTNVRREDTYLFRLNLPREATRALFLSYLQAANELVRRPRFYHTIRGNCTTVLYCMLRRILGRLPFSYRVLLSGYMPEYFYGVGRLDQRYPLETLRTLGYISERARAADQSPSFSADIRAGIPPLS
ncbi:MAG TPA: DUF4105 domain-containing protein [Steroidobacteraceae bacterium]|nr:DUF4105 domain-containing protein [Steroidobacteraceae bacterium]